MKILALFARKYYQSGVGTISYIHLLGKIRQIYEQYWTALFYLIRDNVVDIIKPEDFDYLIKEGVVDHKYDVVQIQLDVLIYLIHTCNSQLLVPDKYGKLILCATNYQNLEEEKSMCW